MSRVNDRDTVTPTQRAWRSVLRTTSVSLLRFISFCNAFLSRRYVFESARGNLEVMAIFMRSDRILYQGQRRLKSRAWTQRKWWHLQFTHRCSLSCFRFHFFGLFSTMVRILLYILTLCFKLIIWRFSTPSWRVGKAVRNFSVCMGIRWQTTFCKIEFYTICESRR
jgi:hypothetical protein